MGFRNVTSFHVLTADAVLSGCLRPVQQFISIMQRDSQIGMILAGYQASADADSDLRIIFPGKLRDLLTCFIHPGIRFIHASGLQDTYKFLASVTARQILHNNSKPELIGILPFS